tara:strand:- start:1776 stop:2954 length:1179 start_codon:yes stop_codon:yes gene_type:complete
MALDFSAKYFGLRYFEYHIDRPLLLSVLALISIGLVMIASASFSFAEHRYGNELYFVKRHLAYLLVGAAAMLAGFFVAPTVWARYGRLWILLSILLLALVLIPAIGREVNGARRWLSLAGFTLQVSELVKVATVVFLASHLQQHRETLSVNPAEFGKLLGVVSLLSLLLILQPDFGSVVVLVATFMAMVFLGGTNLRQYLLVVLVGFLLLYWMAESAPYRLARLTTFLDPWTEKYDSGYQLVQSLIAFGRGGWFGVGLGQSVQKMLYLPEAHTDFVFAIFAEEFGFVGVLVLLGLYITMVLRVFQLAKMAITQKYWYGAYILVGFGLLISGQTFINLGVNAGLLPTKGLTLPFVSYGGSSLMVCCAMVGMMLRIGHEIRSPQQPSRRTRYVR